MVALCTSADLEGPPPTTLMLRYPTLLLASLLSIAPAALGQVQAGDLAVVGYYSDNPDAVALVALVAVPDGTEIALTDNGWLASGGFRANEGTFRYTVPAGGLAAGTVVRIDEPAGLAFSASGDQVLLYTGPDAAPAFVYALNNEGNAVWQADATDSNTSALPAGLVSGATAVALVEADNAAYTGPTAGSRGELLALISDPSNWTTSDDAFPAFPEAFEVDGGGGNLPPTFVTVLPDTQAVVGEPFVFGYDAVDPDGDPLTFTLAGDPSTRSGGHRPRHGRADVDPGGGAGRHGVQRDGVRERRRARRVAG